MKKLKELAEGRTKDCPMCNGVGMVPDFSQYISVDTVKGKTCEACKGKGKVLDIRQKSN